MTPPRHTENRAPALPMFGPDDSDRFDSRRSAKIAVMLCCVFHEAAGSEAWLHRELLALAVEPLVARELLCVLATVPGLASRFADVRAAARSALNPYLLRRPRTHGLRAGSQARQRQRSRVR